MNTRQSDDLLTRYQQRRFRAARRVVEVSGDLPATPETVFPLLCPAREADWIPGWTCDLVFTETGYVEKDCVFTTNEHNPVGPGVWLINRLESPRILELIRFMPHVVKQLKIELTDNGDGSTSSRWTETFTELDEHGTEVITEMASEDKWHQLIAMLRHYLETGEAMAVDA